MNILLQNDPVAAKVADFGLAVDLKATRMTTAGAVMGTVAYMAPEQIRGQQDRVSPRTDVYSLGVTLFEMLTLELPFAGATQQMYMNAVLTTEARRPRKLNERVGRDLEVVVRKALQKDPADRYASAGAFADDLQNILNFRPITARPPGLGSRGVKWARRRPMHAALAGVLIVGVPAVAILGLRSVQHERLVGRLRIEGWKDETNRLLHDDRFQEALVTLGKILADRPDDLDALRDRSMSYARLAILEGDPKRRDVMQRLALGDIDRILHRLPGTRWPYRVRAFELKSFGRDREAQEDEEKAARLVTPSPEFHEVEIDAILAIRAKDYPVAVERLTEMIERRPDSADARLWRGDAHDRMGEAQKAIVDYEVAAALKPSDVYSRVNLARLRTLSGDLDEGAALYRKVLEIDPGVAEAHEGLSANLLEQGRARASAGDPASAEERFRHAEAEARTALDKDPSLAWAHVNLGASLMERNRLLPAPDPGLVAEAVSHDRRAAELTEGAHTDSQQKVYLSALTNQCDALIQVKDLGAALGTCRRVVELQPENAAAHYNLAGVHALSGRRDEALRELGRDVDLGDRDGNYLAADPWFASLRSDPGFKALLARMQKPVAPAPHP
jgi:tetratricopeptide (TPR) repeat protein